MCSRREIARDWGVAKSYVDKCVTKRDCPTTSLQEARKWREENTYRRAPTNQKSLARVFAEEGDINSPEDGILIPLAMAKDIAFRGYDFILGLVEHLPKNTAAQMQPRKSANSFRCSQVRIHVHPLQFMRGVRRVVENRAASLLSAKSRMIWLPFSLLRHHSGSSAAAIFSYFKLPVLQILREAAKSSDRITTEASFYPRLFLF